jgi:hypothetical protein
MNSFRHWLSTIILSFVAFGFSIGFTQQIDPEYVQALSTVYAGGGLAKLVKEWCDERAPGLKAQSARAFEAWRNKMDLPMIDARLIALVGDGKTRIDAIVEEKRDGVYAQLDGSARNSEVDCAGLEKALNDDFNLKVVYSKEYVLIAAQPVNPSYSNESAESGTTAIPATIGADTKIGSSGRPEKSLPNIPAFDYVTFAKSKLDPEKEPIPDEYRCYAEVPGDQYATPDMILQILPGRKYRVSIGAITSEGAFNITGSSLNLIFTSGALASGEEHSFRFDRKQGAQVLLRNIGTENRRRDFTCNQRGGRDQLEQLFFKRKDPQIGVFTCIATDGSGKVYPSKLEVLANRRYRFQNKEGSFKVNITGDHDSSYSEVIFSGGDFNALRASYGEDEAGRQRYDFGGRQKIECTRQVTPRPDPKYGQNKAPASPGTGGLEGRYFVGHTQVALGGSLPCGGVCYSFLFLQKDGYVYNDDAESTDGLEDINCTKTYPSGFPVCQVYSVKGNTLQIGLEKPVSFKRDKNGLTVDGDEYSTIEPLDGVKFDGEYQSLSVFNSSIGGGGGSTSSVDLALRKDGRFFREATNSAFSIATDNGSSTGNTIATASATNSRSNNGTYRVYGNTIEFKYDDGRVIRQFAFLPSGRKDLQYLRIGGRLYWIEDGKK